MPDRITVTYGPLRPADDPPARDAGMAYLASAGDRPGGAPPTGQDSSAVTSMRPGMFLASSLLVLAVVTVASVATYRPSLGISEMWPVPAAVVLVLSPVWGRRSPHHRHRWLVGVLCLVVVWASSLAAGPREWHTLHWSSANVLAGVVMTAILARALRGRWYPRVPHDVFALPAAALAAAVVVVLIDGTPGTHSWDSAPALNLWWVVRISVNCTLGMVFVILAWLPRGHGSLPFRHGWQVPPLLLVTLLCIVLPYLYFDLPLSWLMLAPTMWAGMLLPLRGALWYCVYSMAVMGGCVLLSNSCRRRSPSGTTTCSPRPS